MIVEIATLETMSAWEAVDCDNDLNVIRSTWAFKCKRFPDGLINEDVFAKDRTRTTF